MSETIIEKKYFIYVLELQNDKYYVGKTENAASRIAEHIKKLGSKWTKKYKPKKIIKLYKNCDSFDEDKYTIMYMAIHGMDNVRGGTFCKVNLDHADKVVIQRMIDSATDRCFKCGCLDHFASECQLESKTLETLIKWCKRKNTEDLKFVLLDEKQNKAHEFGHCEYNVSNIDQMKDKFVKRFSSSKYSAILFSMSVTDYDFQIKMLEHDDYHKLYNSNGFAVLCHTEEEDREDIIVRKLKRSIRAALK